MVIRSEIFNLEKTDYEKTPLFLGQDPGVADTINKQYPVLWNLYKKMKSLDWDENEFDFSSCMKDFATCDKPIYDAMIKTLAWQWETDSIVSRHIGPLVAPFVTSTELWALWQRVSDNELVHASTYSEIVRTSFENPRDILAEILSVKEAVARLEVVGTVFSNCYVVSHKVALGIISKDSDEAYDAIFLFTVALYCVERVQFMGSFLVTFSICETGIFMPIGLAVQKICQDEFEVHCATDNAILSIEMKTERGRQAYLRNKHLIKQMVDEVVNSEKVWNEYIFSEGRELVGLDKEVPFKWVLWCAKELYEFFDIESPYELPERDPAPFMQNWISINKNQGSPQEQKLGAYMLGQVRDDSSDKTYDTGDL